MASVETDHTVNAAEQEADQGQKRGAVRAAGATGEKKDRSNTAETPDRDSSGGAGEGGGSAGGTGGGETLVQA